MEEKKMSAFVKEERCGSGKETFDQRKKVLQRRNSSPLIDVV